MLFLFAIELRKPMTLWQTVVLGIVQGLTEFLPISSTAHLLLVQEWFGRTREELKNDPITIVIQLGTLVAVLGYFRKDLKTLISGFARDLRTRRLTQSPSRESRMIGLVILATIPAVIVGGLFASKLKEHFYNPLAIAVVSIVFAILMAASEWWAARRNRQGTPARDDWAIIWKDALIVGLFQACALMPGGSRSGTTLTACLFLGLARPAAARFSFLMAIPAIGAAGAKDLLEWILKGGADFERQALNLFIGTLVSFVVGYVSIAWLMRFLRTYSMGVFVGYRLVLAAVILILVALGIVHR